MSWLQISIWVEDWLKFTGWKKVCLYIHHGDLLSPVWADFFFRNQRKQIQLIRDVLQIRNTSDINYRVEYVLSRPTVYYQELNKLFLRHLRRLTNTCNWFIPFANKRKTLSNFFLYLSINEISRGISS